MTNREKFCRNPVLALALILTTVKFLDIIAEPIISRNPVLALALILTVLCLA